MSWKKSWFSYGVWAVWAVMLCIFMATYINAQCIVFKFGKYATITTVCAAFVLVFGVYILLRFLYQKWGGRLEQVSNHTKMLCEVFFVLSSFVGAVLLRIYWYVHRFSGCYGTMQFYEMAKIKEGGSIPLISHGASYLYTGMLSGIFSFFGNKQGAGICVQIVLQLLAILFFYFAVRNLVGKREAVITLAVLAFFPAMLNYSFTLMPENLYFFLFAGMLFLISLYKKYEEKKERKTLTALFVLLFLGLGCGYLCYLDVVGVLLVPAVIFVILSKQRKAGRSAVYISFLTIGFLLSFFVLLFLEAIFTQRAFVTVIMTWWNLYFHNIGWNAVMAGADLTIAGNLAACIGGAWFLFSFFSKKKDYGCLYMVSLLVLVFFVSFTGQNMSYQLLTTVYWAILAALGVTSVLSVKEKENMVVEVEGGNMKIKENLMEPAETEVLVEDLEIEDMQTGKKPVQFIENPLPLPKKHVKKTMDYKFQPEERLMKYDIEIKDGDDFDLQ